MAAADEQKSVGTGLGWESSLNRRERCRGCCACAAEDDSLAVSPDSVVQDKDPAFNKFESRQTIFEGFCFWWCRYLTGLQEQAGGEADTDAGAASQPGADGDGGLDNVRTVPVAFVMKRHEHVKESNYCRVRMESTQGIGQLEERSGLTGIQLH